MQILKLKMGACLTQNTKHFYKVTLPALASQCNQARNATVRQWLRWREDHPEFKAEKKLNEDGSIKKWKGKPAMTFGGWPQIVDFTTGAVLAEKVAKVKGEKKTGGSFSNFLYGRVCKLVPDLSSSIVAAIANRGLADLKATLPYTYRQKWEAIVNYEQQAPSYNSTYIPVCKQTMVLTYDGEYFSGFGDHAKMPADERKKIQPPAGVKNEGCVIRFPMFTGHGSAAIVRLKVGRMPSNLKKVLKQCVRGELDISDSSIIEENGIWYFMLTYTAAGKELNLNKANYAEFLPSPVGSRQLFDLVMYSADGKPLLADKDGNPKVWTIGQGAGYLEELIALENRRKVIRHKYKYGQNRGHGMARWYRPLKKLSYKGKFIVDRMKKDIVAELVKALDRHDVGTVKYLEPTKPLRGSKKMWLSESGCRFDWTAFASFLTHKMVAIGADLQTQRYKYKDYCGRYAAEIAAAPKSKPTAAKTPALIPFTFTTAPIKGGSAEGQISKGKVELMDLGDRFE